MKNSDVNNRYREEELDEKVDNVNEEVKEECNSMRIL